MNPVSDSSASFAFIPASLRHVHFLMISLEQEFSLLKLVLKDANRVVYKWDLVNELMQWSDNVLQVLPFVSRDGITKESQWVSFIHPEDRTRFLDMRQSFLSAPGEQTLDYFLKPQGDLTYQVKQTGSIVRDGAQEFVIGMIDCQLVQKPQDYLPSQMGFVPNATLYPAGFLSHLSDAVEHGVRTGAAGELMIVSIKNLTMIINAYGHDAAEQVMNDLIAIIGSNIPITGSIERVHHDQFGLILPACTKEHARRLADCINVSIQNYGSSSVLGSLHVLCSIGSVDFPDSAKTAHDAVNRAYMALSSGTHGIMHRAFEETMDESAQSRQQMGLANYLCKAVQENRLRLAYQPIIETKSGTISHYEALLRLTGEDGKISSAGALIPIAERMGLIDMIDHMVLDMVIKELLASPNVTLAFNVSNLTTENARWLEHFTQAMECHPQLASRIIVEITETAAQRDLRRTAYFVASLQALGCQVALDDFGSGYTSFRQLKSLSVDMVKIDGAFIKDLAENADNRFFVKTLLDFTNGFGLTAVAEYVENGETAKMLMELGVEYMQGYYFGKPENFRAWLNTGEYEKE